MLREILIVLSIIILIIYFGLYYNTPPFLVKSDIEKYLQKEFQNEYKVVSIERNFVPDWFHSVAGYNVRVKNPCNGEIQIYKVGKKADDKWGYFPSKHYCGIKMNVSGLERFEAFKDILDILSIEIENKRNRANFIEKLAKENYTFFNPVTVDALFNEGFITEETTVLFEKLYNKLYHIRFFNFEGYSLDDRLEEIMKLAKEIELLLKTN